MRAILRRCVQAACIAPLPVQETSSMHDPHDLRDLMRDASARALRYLDELDERPVAPRPEAVAQLDPPDISFPESGTAPLATLAEIDRYTGATMAMNGARFFR